MHRRSCPFIDTEVRKTEFLLRSSLALKKDMLITASGEKLFELL